MVSMWLLEDLITRLCPGRTILALNWWEQSLNPGGRKGTHVGKNVLIRGERNAGNVSAKTGSRVCVKKEGRYGGGKQKVFSSSSPTPEQQPEAVLIGEGKK